MVILRIRPSAMITHGIPELPRYTASRGLDTAAYIHPHTYMLQVEASDYHLTSNRYEHEES